MIEPLRFHSERAPTFAVKHPLYCGLCLSKGRKNEDANVAVKFCTHCERNYFLCLTCDEEIHRFGINKHHVRRTIVLGPGIRKRMITRGDALNFPYLFDTVRVKYSVRVFNDGKIVYREPSKCNEFIVGLSGKCIHVQILGARNLIGNPSTIDPFVISMYMGKKLGSTRIRPRTLTPKWKNETFIIPVEDNLPPVRNPPKTQQDLFRLEVYDHNYITQNNLLGLVELSKDRLVNLASTSNQRPIRLHLSAKQFHGLLGIQMGCSSDSFHMKVCRGEALNKGNSGDGLSNPYVKFYFGDELIGTTQTVYDTLDPEWTNTNEFRIGINDILKREYELLKRKLLIDLALNYRSKITNKSSKYQSMNEYDTKSRKHVEYDMFGVAKGTNSPSMAISRPKSPSQRHRHSKLNEIESEVNDESNKYSSEQIDSITMFKLEVYHTDDKSRQYTKHLGTCRITVDYLRKLLPTFPSEYVIDKTKPVSPLNQSPKILQSIASNIGIFDNLMKLPWQRYQNMELNQSQEDKNQYNNLVESKTVDDIPKSSTIDKDNGDSKTSRLKLLQPSADHTENADDDDPYYNQVNQYLIESAEKTFLSTPTSRVYSAKQFNADTIEYPAARGGKKSNSTKKKPIEANPQPLAIIEKSKESTPRSVLKRGNSEHSRKTMKKDGSMSSQSLSKQSSGSNQSKKKSKLSKYDSDDDDDDNEDMDFYPRVVPIPPPIDETTPDDTSINNETNIREESKNVNELETHPERLDHEDQDDTDEDDIIDELPYQHDDTETNEEEDDEDEDEDEDEFEDHLLHHDQPLFNSSTKYTSTSPLLSLSRYPKPNIKLRINEDMIEDKIGLMNEAGEPMESEHPLLHPASVIKTNYNESSKGKISSIYSFIHQWFNKPERSRRDKSDPNHETEKSDPSKNQSFITWSKLRHFKIEYENKETVNQNIDRGYLVVRLIPSNRGQVISGLDEAIRHMSLGEKSSVLVRYDYAYGNYCVGAHIPSRSNMIFNIQLLQINENGRLQLPIRIYKRIQRYFKRLRIHCSNEYNQWKYYWSIQYQSLIKIMNRWKYGSSKDDITSHRSKGFNQSRDALDHPSDQDTHSNDHHSDTGSENHPQSTQYQEIKSKRIITKSAQVGSQYLWNFDPSLSTTQKKPSVNYNSHDLHRKYPRQSILHEKKKFIRNHFEDDDDDDDDDDNDDYLHQRSSRDMANAPTPHERSKRIMEGRNSIPQPTQQDTQIQRSSFISKWMRHSLHIPDIILSPRQSVNVTSTSRGDNNQASRLGRSSFLSFFQMNPSSTPSRHSALTLYRSDVISPKQGG